MTQLINVLLKMSNNGSAIKFPSTIIVLVFKIFTIFSYYFWFIEGSTLSYCPFCLTEHTAHFRKHPKVNHP